MALTAAMGSGIAGLRAFMDALNVVGNNVANVNTYGYKAGRVTFKESIYSTQSAGSASTDVTGGTNPNQIGYGSSVGTIDLDMSTQALESTGMATDVAIQGDGFFLLGPKSPIVKADSLNSLMFSRVGNFKIDDDGYLTDGAGNIVYGFVPVSADATGATQQGTAGINPSNTPSTQLVPIRLPLASDGTVPAYGDEGKAVYPGVDTNGTGENIPIADGTAGISNKCIKYENLQIDSSGKVTCTNSMTNDIVTVGYIALGSVTNPAGLTHTDGPYYQATDSAGDISISTPKSSVTGELNNGKSDVSLLASSGTSVMSGFLEQSGTDLATEFANMIIYQRGYQANTRIVTVTDTMLEELINMKR